MRVIYQNEVSECGYACLAMVLTHFGRSTEVHELSALHPVSANGARLSDLYDVAVEFGLSVKAMAFEAEHIPQIRKGSIVHFNGTHFVIFESSGRGYVRIIDPATGRRRLSIGTFLKNVSGYLLECSATPSLPKIKGESEAWEAIKAVFALNRELKSQFFKIFFVAFGAQFAILAAPYLGSLVLDNVVAENNVNLLNVLIFTFTSIFLVGSFSQYVQAYLTEVVYQRTHGKSTEALFGKLLKNRFSYFEKRHVGDVFARIKSQTEIVDYVSRSLIAFLIDLFVGCMALILMLVQSPLLTAVALGIFVIYISVSCALYPKMMDSHRQEIEASAQCDDALIETIRSATLIKLAQRENQRVVHYMHRFHRLMNDSFRARNLTNVRDAILKFVGYADTIIVTYISVALMLKGEISVGVFYSFLVFKGLLSTHLSRVVNAIFQFLMLRVPVARVNDVWKQEGERYTSADLVHKASEVFEFDRIEVRNVSFQYGLSDQPVLQEVDLTIHKGDKIAIVGPSGAGKSTLFKLLGATEDFQQGSISLNGIDYHNLAVDEIRRHMAHMRQGDIILNGTIADNVSLFAAGADSQRINALLTDVGLYDEVMRLPMRTQTPVSDTIANISAGQRQRLLLARTLYQERELMLFDEPTSNLDRDSAETIGSLLRQSNKTIVIITHDQELAKSFPRRYRLHDGRLVAL